MEGGGRACRYAGDYVRVYVFVNVKDVDREKGKPLCLCLSVYLFVCLFLSVSVSVSLSVSVSISVSLTLYGLSANTLSLICSFLNSRLQKVSLKDNQSDFKTVLSGVPQGSILGPLLFSIYINDPPLHIPSAQCDMLSDDTTIPTSGQDISARTSVLQSCLSDVVEWTHLNYMSLNPSKRKYIILTTRQKRQLLHLLSTHLSVGNQQITEVSDHKVLGVTIDNNLTWGPHIRDLCKTTTKKSTNQQKLSIFLTFMPEKRFPKHTFSQV